MTTKLIHFDSNNSVNSPTTIIDPITSTLKTVYHSFNTYYYPQLLFQIQQTLIMILMLI